MDPYSSHLPILKELFKIVPIKRVWEYGCGRFSTPLFAANCNEVIAIEMQSHDWFTTMQGELSQYPNLVLKEALGAWTALDVFKGLDERWDMVFVDGHGDSRWNCINLACDKTDIVVAHDTEAPLYGWDHIMIPNNFVEIRFKQYHPWTTIWTCNDNVIQHFVTQAKLIEGVIHDQAH